MSVYLRVFTAICDTIVSSADRQDSMNALADGYGFATFAYVVGFILACACSIYSSPLFCGSVNERKLLSKPENLESTGTVPVATEAYSGYPDKI
jgi:hypothetical protein